MPSRMHGSLSSLAGQIPRVVREHEVLRVSALICGDDPPALANSAISEILKWAQKRCGGRLPAEAWEHKPFEHLSGGRNSSCVRLQSGDSDIWAIRADDPDKNVPGRVWTNEVVVGLLSSEAVRFSARQMVSTPENELLIAPHTPGFIQQVVETCGLVSGNQHLSIAPLVFETADDADELIEHLLNPKRALPTFVVTLPENVRSDHPTIETAALSRAMLGIAHVALVYPEVTWRLTERFGKFKSVFGGAARVYLPGFSDDSDPFGHRLVLADQIATQADAGRCTRWIRQLAAGQSVRRMKLGNDVLSFAAIRNASLQLRQQTLKQAEASENEQLSAAEDRIAALEKQVEQQESEVDYYVVESEKERERAEISESQSQKSAYRIQQLAAQLKLKGDDPDQNLVLPTSWSELPDWCDQHLAGRLVLTRSAHRGARKPEFRDVETAARCLLWIAKECRDQRIAGGSGSINNITVMDGILNASCGSNAYEFDWNGRRFSADWHVKNGGNTRDPSRCLRIYYCFDEQTQQIIVSDLPAHRKTGAS